MKSRGRNTFEQNNYFLKIVLSTLRYYSILKKTKKQKNQQRPQTDYCIVDDFIIFILQLSKLKVKDSNLPKVMEVFDVALNSRSV